MLREGHFRLGGHHLCLRLGDHRSLTLKRRPGIFQLRLGHHGFGGGRFGGGAQVAVIDQRQQLPGLDLLVVFHQHLLDEAGNAGHHQRVVGRDIGIIGALLRALAEQAGRQQINQDARRDHDADANGYFLLGLSRHENLLFQ
ncbi:hypothetical protein D3C81_1818390 [compost metagenome]